MPVRTPAKASAFTLIELLVVIAIIALLISLLLPGLGHARKSARTMLCSSGLQQFAAGLHSYSSDQKDVTSAFSWHFNKAYSQWNDLNYGATHVQSHADQAVDIVRRLTASENTYYDRVTGRMMDRNFSHLPLLDGGYLNQNGPERATACPEDRATQIWQAHVGNYQTALQMTGDPDPAASVAFKKMLPFWSTYQFVPNSWSHEHIRNPLYQASGVPGYHLLYYHSGNLTHLGPRKLSDVMFPAQKVWVFDLFDRHSYKRPIWHAYEMAAQPLMLFDGSVQMRKTADSNEGWNPINKTGGPTIYQYYPFGNEPRTLSGNPADTVKGYFRWTRGGIRGVDFGGGEVMTRW